MLVTISGAIFLATLCSEMRSPAGCWKLKLRTGCGAPSSMMTKSSACKSEIGSPLLLVTTTSTTTRRDDVLKTNGAGCFSAGCVVAGDADWAAWVQLQAPQSAKTANAAKHRTGIAVAFIALTSRILPFWDEMHRGGIGFHAVNLGPCWYVLGSGGDSKCPIIFRVWSKTGSFWPPAS